MVVFEVISSRTQTALAGVTGSSRPAGALAGALRIGFRPIADRLPERYALSLLRAALDTGARLLRPDPTVTIVELDDLADESNGLLPGEWVLPAEPGDGAILYLHGGGFASGSPSTHRAITGRLAADTGLPVLVPDYRLAPEHPFPAAFEDGLDAYRWLLDQGIPASKIVVVGDSSGGHLAAAVVGEASRLGLPSPAGVVLFSPWVDLTCELSALGDRECRDPFISPELAQHFSRLYVGDEDWSDPRLSLLDLAGLDLPPFLVQVGGIEALRAEAEHLVEALTDAGASCELQVWPGQMHVFQFFNRLFPEAGAAMTEAAAFVRSHVEAAEDEALDELAEAVDEIFEEVLDEAA
ncbi:alpha/beta hydrolase [Actinoallomurus sp. CA-150999]|uniref:alpha/beta hydrolase n=1 Tax=Actinoallomurus sp. CA-150999 TaxID=3239887 RepID=UPI003D8DFDE4